ncbi:MAG: hypothetical protein HY801_04800, partial [Candidatus Lindowbacteria bacterium]|nr:hypothetical protein [Candidatus Lindowbacteria bacterium]
VLSALSRQLGLAMVDLDRQQPDPACTHLVPEKLAMEKRVVPLRLGGITLTLAPLGGQQAVAFELLDKTGVMQIVETSYRILEEIGIKLGEGRVRDVLRDHGCSDRDGRTLIPAS